MQLIGDWSSHCLQCVVCLKKLVWRLRWNNVIQGFRVTVCSSSLPALDVMRDINGIHLTSGGAADSDTVPRRRPRVQMSAGAPNVFACKEVRRRCLEESVMPCLVCAGFGYCAAATRAFVEEAAASGAEVRLSEAVMDVRMQPSRAGPSQIAGEHARPFAGALCCVSIKDGLWMGKCSGRPFPSLCLKSLI